MQADCVAVAGFGGGGEVAAGWAEDALPAEALFVGGAPEDVAVGGLHHFAKARGPDGEGIAGAAVGGVAGVVAGFGDVHGHGLAHLAEVGGAGEAEGLLL